ncbi:orotidine-5'-phosphate decarboxylase [Methylobacillus sp. Pita1]|uniref:orotidine-5'-phosphate decarboxylase n=1 Tax=Methylobacillus sp. Pita1 TaxID=3382642 RepID=UPI0038B4B847
MNFIEKLEKSWEKSNSLVCVGLDPDLSRFPEHIKNQSGAIFSFLKDIVDATHDIACCFKPQIAYFSAISAEDELQQVIKYIKTEYPHIPVILDAKRGDIGSTSRMYAVESFERYEADAVTINPYMGFDSVQPFLEYRDRGIAFLCRTSNAGASDIQDLLVDGLPLYEHIAKIVHEKWNVHKNSLLVVGATWPQQMEKIRSLVGDMPFLVPGVGSQGGNVEELVKAGQTENGTGLIISASRAILYASQDPDYAEVARSVTIDLKDNINLHRSKKSP